MIHDGYSDIQLEPATVPGLRACPRIPVYVHTRYLQETEKMARWLGKIPYIQQACHGVRRVKKFRG